MTAPLYHMTPGQTAADYGLVSVPGHIVLYPTGSCGVADCPAAGTPFLVARDHTGTALVYHVPDADTQQYLAAKARGLANDVIVVMGEEEDAAD